MDTCGLHEGSPGQCSEGVEELIQQAAERVTPASLIARLKSLPKVTPADSMEFVPAKASARWTGVVATVITALCAAHAAGDIHGAAWSSALLLRLPALILRMDPEAERTADADRAASRQATRAVVGARLEKAELG